MAGLYDGLLLGSLILFATIPAVILNHGEAIAAGDPLFQGYLLLVAFGYFGLSWTHGGQTLGAKSWRVQVVQVDGQPLGMSRAALRFAWCVASLAALGLGFAWAIIDRENRGWPDLFTGTRLIVRPRQRRSPG